MAIGTAAVRPIPEGVTERTADSTAPSVSIVMPCLNEEETVGICVEKAMGWLARCGTPGEVWSSTTGRPTGPRKSRRPPARA